MRQSMDRAASSIGPDAPADLSDCRGLRHAQSAIAGEWRLPFAARRAGPGKTAAALGLDPIKDANFREQDIGTWTGRRHNDLLAELAMPTGRLEIAGK